MVGRTLSHYSVLEEISRGGMGVVYRAVDLKLNREVALKVLPPELVADETRKARFIQEARAAAALYHPHIATVFEIDEEQGTTFIAMELIDGEKLRQTLPVEGYRFRELFHSASSPRDVEATGQTLSPGYRLGASLESLLRIAEKDQGPGDVGGAV
jgi:serine/threonine protein kinase